MIIKIEIGKGFPQYFKPSYPEEFELFSHFETTAGIPTILFAITTWKENGKPNVCFHSWSCFHGDKTASFAVMGNLYQHTHTYANIQRENCFCINFLPISYYDKLIDTINHNDLETDEFAAGNFTLSNAKTVHAPVIQEAFINMECTLKEIQDLSGAGITAMVTDIRENNDGTITLTVEAVCEMVICDDSVITHELTVRFAEDGSFQYLGNEILNGGIEKISAYQYRIHVE